jgi:glycosyltransferase involved in cell wall biosynthesis
LRDQNQQVRGYLPYASFDVPLVLRLGFRRRPSVVVVETPPTTGAAVRLVQTIRRGPPYVYYAADVVSLAAEGIGTAPHVVSLLRHVESRILRNAARVLTVSESMQAEVVALGVDPARVVQVGHGVDTSVFTPDPSSTSATPVAVYAGTMSEIHGATIFLEAFDRIRTRHPQARVFFVGWGTDRVRIASRARDFAGQVEVLPPRSPAELAPLLRKAWVGLASLDPSQGYTKAHPTKIYSSLASGTPVLLAGEGPAISEIRSNRLGWAVPWDVAATAEALDEALREAPSAAFRMRLANWTSDGHSMDRVAACAASAILEVVEFSRR